MARTEFIDDIPVRLGPYPEFTWTAILIGWGLGALIAVSISYAALKLGFSIEGSELAAILGWGILRGLLRRTSILENNINQTVASAVNQNPPLPDRNPTPMVINETKKIMLYREGKSSHSPTGHSAWLTFPNCVVINRNNADTAAAPNSSIDLRIPAPGDFKIVATAIPPG